MTGVSDVCSSDLVLLLPEAFTLRTILAEGCMHTLGEGPETDQPVACGGIKQDDWPEGRQRPGKLSPKGFKLPKGLALF